MWGRAAFGPRAVVWGPLWYRISVLFSELCFGKKPKAISASSSPSDVIDAECTVHINNGTPHSPKTC